MQEIKAYDLYLSLIFKIFIFGMFGLFLVIGIAIVVADIFFFTNDNGPPWFFGVFIMLIAGWNFYYIFSFPYRIIVDEDEIIFTSLLQSRKIFISEIESIKPDPSQFFGFLIIKTQNRKIKILNQFDGFHDFILNLKVKNPLIELRGC